VPKAEKSPRVRRTHAKPELSVVIPTLNEAEALPDLLGDLAAQQGVICEILVSDGGSSDGTAKLAAELLDRHRLTGKVLGGSAGRGQQLNHGAAQARAEWLLFLHADSRLPEATALASSLHLLRCAGQRRLAGHFTLQYNFSDRERVFGYYLSEVKARLGWPGTIHGDQGFLLSKAFFAELGGFRDDLPVLEDTLLAETIRDLGDWYLLPATIITSPRRFLAEGYRERQTLNALLANFALIGWDQPLLRFSDSYRRQDQTGALQLAPFYRLVDQLLIELPWSFRWRVWYRTGRFVRNNAWQLVLRRVARTAYLAGDPVAAVPLTTVSRFRSWFEPLTNHPLGNLTAVLLTWLWFRSRSRNHDHGV